MRTPAGARMAATSAEGLGRSRKLHHPTPTVSIFVRIMLIFIML